MRLNKLVMSVAALAVVSSGLLADTSAMDVEKIFDMDMLAHADKVTAETK